MVFPLLPVPFILFWKGSSQDALWTLSTDCTCHAFPQRVSPSALRESLVERAAIPLRRCRRAGALFSEPNCGAQCDVSQEKDTYLNIYIYIYYIYIYIILYIYTIYIYYIYIYYIYIYYIYICKYGVYP